LEPTSRIRPDSKTDEPELTSKHRAALRKRWANLIRRVHKTDPLLCACGGRFRILAFITEPKLIARILEHLLSLPPVVVPSKAAATDGSPNQE
jgi:hypothetical protein